MVDEALLSNAGSDERESSELKKVSPLPPTPDVSAAPNKEDRQKPPSIKTLILEPHGTHEGTDRLVGGGIIPEEQQLIDYNMADAPFRQGHMARSPLLDSPSTFKILRGGENDHAKSDRGNPAVQPDMVIVAIPDESTLSHYRDTLRQLADEMWHDFPESDRPMVVLSCNGFDPPGYLKQLYQGFRFVRDTDELKRLTQQNTDMVALRQRGEDHRPGGLVVKQEQQYDASEDLRLWEQKTANTYESLRHIYDRSRQRNAALERYGMGVNGAPLRKEMSVLDLGTGEGRIGGMIARTGGNVVGMDISSAMLKRARERIREEGAGLRGEKEDPLLSYHALQRLKQEGALPQEPIFDDAEVERHYVTVKGDFFNMQEDLNTLVNNWQNSGTDISLTDFFNVGDDELENVYANPENKFMEMGFDRTLVNWNTWCEIGKANQEIVLEQIMNVTYPGGELTIEISDRSQSPYAEALQENQRRHPEDPYGTIRDQKDTGEEFSPRYFPDVGELGDLLASKGFDFDPTTDIQTYFIEQTDSATGEKKPPLKQYFITARKPTR